MSVPGLIFALVLIAIAVAWVVVPLFRREGQVADALPAKQRERPNLYYERVMTNIRDLDEEVATGKIDEAAYTRDREVWVARGVQVLQALDALDGQRTTGIAATAAEDAAVDRAIETAIEAAVAAYRKS